MPYQMLVEHARTQVPKGEVWSAVVSHDDWCTVDTEGDGSGCICDAQIALYDHVINNGGRELFILDNR